MVVLEINDVVESDAGLYRVKAKNKFGEVAASINLNFSRKFSCLLSLSTATLRCNAHWPRILLASGLVVEL